MSSMCPLSAAAWAALLLATEVAALLASSAGVGRGGAASEVDVQGPAIHQSLHENLVRSGWERNGGQYRGWKMISTVHDGVHQVRQLKQIIKGMRGVRLWNDRFEKDRPAYIMVSPDMLANLTGKFRQAGMKTRVMIEDLAVPLMKDFGMQLNTLKSRREDDHDDIIGRYPRLDEIHRWLDRKAQMNPEVVEVTTIGQSLEGRNIKVVRIRRAEDLPVVYVECNIHAREWISLTSCLWYINELLEMKLPETQALAQMVEWRIVPTVNPDGYEFSHTHDRFWRKNRNLNRGNRCEGVDINRNFDFHWGTEDHSEDSCTESYPGDAAFSEPEAQVIKKYIEANKDRIWVFFDMHSYSQLWLVPPSSGPRPTDLTELLQLGKDAAAQVYATHHHTYRSGWTEKILYEASGCAYDWAQSKDGGPAVKYSFVIELRPDGQSWKDGFLLPPNQIIPTAEESYAGILHVARAAVAAHQVRQKELEETQNRTSHEQAATEQRSKKKRGDKHRHKRHKGGDVGAKELEVAADSGNATDVGNGTTEGNATVGGNTTDEVNATDGIEGENGEETEKVLIEWGVGSEEKDKSNIHEVLKQPQTPWETLSWMASRQNIDDDGGGAGGAWLLRLPRSANHDRRMNVPHLRPARKTRSGSSI